MPIPGPPGDFGRSTVFFPVVGALVGGCGAATYWLASALWPTTIATVLAMATTVVVTGALHEDGLADAADGFGGGTTGERVLEIMKDSRIGAYGAVALVLALVTKWAALTAMPRVDVVRALIVAHTLARWSSVPLLARYPYVRAGGSPFGGTVTTAHVAGATIIGAGIVAVLGWRAAPAPLATALVVAAIVTASAGWYFRRRLGGITGDCLGAANQLVEIAVYLTLAAYAFGQSHPNVPAVTSP